MLGNIMRCVLQVSILLCVTALTAAHAADWRKLRGEFAPESADCIDFDSIRTDSQGLTRFRRYVVDDDKACGRPNQHDTIETIAVSCSAVTAAGTARDDFPVKYYSYDRAAKRWEQATGASRQFARVMQYVCQNRK
jgi:hypothetical protein